MDFQRMTLIISTKSDAKITSKTKNNLNELISRSLKLSNHFQDFTIIYNILKHQ